MPKPPAGFVLNEWGRCIAAAFKCIFIIVRSWPAAGHQYHRLGPPTSCNAGPVLSPFDREFSTKKISIMKRLLHEFMRKQALHLQVYTEEIRVQSSGLYLPRIRSRVQHIHRRIALSALIKIYGCFLFHLASDFDNMRPHLIIVGALKMINIIAPSWRVIPATNMIDKIRKDPQLKKKICFNPYMYRGNLALQIGCKLLSVSLDIKKSLHEVRSSPSVRPPHATLVA
ncbi:hypothetical protein ZEAMMB73_Zm00001d013735 [Zea mays]|uniref:Uncharacterized protein n=1 Tax=Zea mays TaxID=4577 RepID=A0A1D6GLS1_MAIZE|nr:hypothetical protein ZEAMMB73_Zm00001d013735 [Zea mays]AQK64260.1 hypothetical protein ZEAMMB73_Zm00001d013735 [Zea mays]